MLPDRILPLVLLLVSVSCSRPSSNRVLDKLDAALELQDTYDGYFRQRTSMLHELLSTAADPASEYDIVSRLASEYSAYNLDTTVIYLRRNLEMAASLGDNYRYVETEMALALEYAIAGYHVESSDILRRYSYKDIQASLKGDYFRALHTLSGESMAYAQNEELKLEKKRERDRSRDSLLCYTAPGSFEWYELKSEEAKDAGQDSLYSSYLRKMLESCEVNSHDYAKACFHMQYCTSDTNEKIEWLARSAIADVMCSVKDYAALQSLSVLLFDTGDIDRAFRYTANHSMPDAIFFNGKLRPWQIALFFPSIEQAYAAKELHQRKTLLRTTAFALTLLLVLTVLLVCFVIRHRMLVHTRNELESRNTELERITARMLESDKVKEEYIMQFLSILSKNIDTTRQYKNHVRTYILRNNEKYLLQEIEALPPIEEDVQEFYKMFDRTFVNLYPDFADKFNALLREGEGMVPKGDDLLTPEMRIFALIKLGITDYSRIAELLHYSSNTIYNYRAKVKNRARDRDNFESSVKSIT